MMKRFDISKEFNHGHSQPFISEESQETCSTHTLNESIKSEDIDEYSNDRLQNCILEPQMPMSQDST